MRPTLRMLSESLVEQIIAEGMALLREPGVRVHNEEARRLLAEAGAEVDQTALVARIPEQLVLRALETTAHEFDLYTLDGQPVVHYGGDQVHFDPGSAALAILDPETNRQRVPTTADFVRLVKLVEQLPQSTRRARRWSAATWSPRSGTSTGSTWRSTSCASRS